MYLKNEWAMRRTNKSQRAYMCAQSRVCECMQNHIVEPEHQSATLSRGKWKKMQKVAHSHTRSHANHECIFNYMHFSSFHPHIFHASRSHKNVILQWILVVDETDDYMTVLVGKCVRVCGVQEPKKSKEKLWYSIVNDLWVVAHNSLYSSSRRGILFFYKLIECERIEMNRNICAGIDH